VDSKKSEIAQSETRINLLNSDLTALKNRLNMSAFLGETLFNELIPFIHKGEWSNDNIFDETELYEKSYEELEKRRSPPIDIKTN
ncbi:hypothetical protein R0K05_22340, partial [Planococcus sp. SIMBA_160]